MLSKDAPIHDLPRRRIQLGYLLIIICLLLLPSLQAVAQSTTLGATEIRERLIGNSLAFHHKGTLIGRRYLAEDGTTVFDPLRGFQIPGHWEIDEETDRLCMWDADPAHAYCARFIVGDGRYFIDWGEGEDRDFFELLEPGDRTDPTDNPGPDYKPHPDILFPADLDIRPPAVDVPEDIAALSGAWFGTYSVWRDYLIVVEKIDASHADVVYVWGLRSFRPDEPGWSRHRASVKDGTLEFDPGWGTIGGRLGEDGALAVTIRWHDGSERSHAIRWDVPSAAPQAPIASQAPDPASARDKLTFRDLQEGDELGTDPLHNAYFMPLGRRGAAGHAFVGRLTLRAARARARKPASRGGRDYGSFPEFSLDFITHGDRLVPAKRGIIATSPDGECRWDIIVEPGRIWSEEADRGWSRASFPFLLIGPQFGDGHNGLATFLFDDTRISKLRFQTVKESSPPYAHLDIWGEAEASYLPRALEDQASIAERFRAELEAQVEIRPWSDLEDRFGAETVAPFDATVIRPQISTSGLIVDGTLYATGCRTRYGPYPYCREMRHGVHSMTKTMGAYLSLLRLAEKYGDHVFDLKLVDYVEIAAAHDGWKDVTFEHAISMVSGIGSFEPTRVSHYVDVNDKSAGRFAMAKSARDRLAAVAAFGNYPWGPGEVFRYSYPGLFVLGAAMDRLLKSKEGQEAHLWEMMNQEVFQPIGIPYLPALHTIEEEGLTGYPLLANGMFATLEDIAKIERLLRNQGRYDGVQLLHAEKLRESLEEGYRKGYPTGWMIDQGEVHYYRSFWVAPQASRAGCASHIPYMAGIGGNYIMVMPNGLTAIRFAGGSDDDDDSGTWNHETMRQVADAIKPLCVP